MGFIAPALPWLAKGAGVLGGILGGRKAQQSAMQRSPEEQAAIAGITGAAQNLTASGQQISQLGTGLAQSGMNLQRPAAGYYQTLLRGSRPAMAQAVAAPTAAITETYRGAERGLERSGVRGAAKDVATADLNRQRASQIAGLTTGVQPFAAEALAGMGGQQIGQGVGAATAGAGVLGQAGNLYGGLLQSGTANRQYGRQEGAQMGAGLGGLIFDLINGLGGRGGKGGGIAPLPTPGNPNLPYRLPGFSGWQT